MVSQQTAARGAQVIFIPPPLYYAAGLVGGVLLDQAVPWTVGGRPATAVVGAAVGLLGAVLTGSGAAAVVRHRTTIVPHRAVATLITTGPYRISRNPMYAGLAVLYAGLSLVIGSWWPLLLEPLVLLAVRLLVIRPEERYLDERFGAAYAEYRARVRRWL